MSDAARKWPGCERLGLEPEVQVLVPTRDGSAMVQTMVALGRIGLHLPVPSHVWWQQASNIPRCRNDLVYGLRKDIKRDRAWCLWVDSDIFLTDLRPVLAAIERSFQTGEGFTAEYRMGDGRSHCMRAKSLDPEVASNYSHEEIEAADPWMRIGQCGFGFLFLPMDLTYKFYADFAGEDVRYWLDHPEQEVGLAKDILLRHVKTVWL